MSVIRSWKSSKCKWDGQPDYSTCCHSHHHHGLVIVIAIIIIILRSWLWSLEQSHQSSSSWQHLFYCLVSPRKRWYWHIYKGVCWKGKQLYKVFIGVVLHLTTNKKTWTRKSKTIRRKKKKTRRRKRGINLKSSRLCSGQMIGRSPHWTDFCFCDLVFFCVFDWHAFQLKLGQTPTLWFQASLHWHSVRPVRDWTSHFFCLNSDEPKDVAAIIIFFGLEISCFHLKSSSTSNLIKNIKSQAALILRFLQVPVLLRDCNNRFPHLQSFRKPCVGASH